MRNKLILGSCILGLTGCASIHIPEVNLQTIQPKRITIYRNTPYTSPEMIIKTPGKALVSSMFATAGSIAGRNQDNLELFNLDAAKKYGIADPAITIESKLTDHLKNKYNVELNISKEMPQNGDLEISVSTQKWGAEFAGITTPNSYYSYYVANLYVSEWANGKRVNSSTRTCTFPRGNTVSHKELTDNNAALLKTKMQEATEICVRQFINNFQ